MLINHIKQLQPKTLTTKLISLFLIGGLLISSHIVLQLSLNKQDNVQLQTLKKLISEKPEQSQKAFQAFNQQLEKHQTITIAALILIAFLILFIGIFFSKTIIINPIKLLISNFKKLAQGDDHIELRIDRNDEFGQLGACFNEININLQQAMSTWELVMESEACKAAISDAALDGILTLDSNLIINTYNSAADKLLEIDDFDMSDQYFPDIAFTESHRKEYTQLMRQVSNEEEESIFSKITEITMQGRGAKIFPAEISVASVIQKGEAIYIIYIRDISLHKQAEKDMQESRDAAIMLAHKQSDFMANISHEIRTPMNGLLGMLSVLERQLNIPEDKKEYLTAATQSANRLQDIINNIINFSQLNSGTLEICNANILLNDLINAVNNKHSKNFNNKQLNFTSVTANNCPLSLHSDPVCIISCLDLLLDNALKFTEHGDITLNITLGESTQQPSLIFTITDTGCGISKEEQEKIFSPFTQADASRSRAYDGAGIGLYMCKQIAELLGGDITLTSEKNKGSSFVLSIPYIETLSDNYISLESLLSSSDKTNIENPLDSIDLNSLSTTLNMFSDTEKTLFINSVSSTSSETLVKLNQSIDNKNTDSSKKLIHKLKGTYSNIHATRLIAYCETLEKEIINNEHSPESIPKLKDHLKSIEDETSNVIKKVQQLIA